jgi:hypothetical protein
MEDQRTVTGHGVTLGLRETGDENR